MRGQRRCEEAIAVYEQLGAAARACGDVETVYRSYKERSIASAMAGDAAGAARHALAQLDYATVLGEPARISQAVDLCHERDMGRVLSPHPGELATLVGRVRAIAPPAMRIEAAIALAAASFLGRGDRQGLLDEAAQTAQSAGMTQRASAALAARAALPP